MSFRSATTNPNNRGFNIADFKSVISRQGLLHSHSYIVVIPYPEGLQRTATPARPRQPAFQAVSRNLEYICDAVMWPSTGLDLYPVQRYSYGAIEMKPTTPKFSVIQCSFICDASADVPRLFSDWIRVAVNYDFDGGIAENNNGKYAYEIAYKPDYAVDMFIYQYDNEGNQVRNTLFREAFPVEIGQQVLSWGKINDIIKIPVTFSFTDWQEQAIE